MIPTTGNHLVAGIVISTNNKLYRIEQVAKLDAPKGTPAVIKSKLRCLDTDKVTEKLFKADEVIDQLALEEKFLEFLYMEEGFYLFLDIHSLEQIKIPPKVIGASGSYIKEAVELRATFYGNSVFTVELPQFLELMVLQIEGGDDDEVPVAEASKIAVLETGAKIRVPPFIETGDIIKVDTKNEEFVQRV